MSTTRALLQLLIASMDADEQRSTTLTGIAQSVHTMSEAIQLLAAQVAAQTDQITALQASIDTKQEAIATAIAALQQQVADGGVDPAALQAIADTLAANTAAIDAAALDVADTPVPEAPAPVDPPV